MAENEENRDEMKVAGRFLEHGAAIILGIFLMVVGMAMGVTIVMLPIGIPVGIGGLLMLMWGLWGKSQA